MIRFAILTPLLICASLVLSAQTAVQLDYIEKYKDIAIREMDRAGIPASIKLGARFTWNPVQEPAIWPVLPIITLVLNVAATGMAKKPFGKMMILMRTVNYSNLAFVYIEMPKIPIIAHSEFLRDPRKEHRYGFLFRLDPTDYRRWAKGLKKSGYATSATYDQKLIAIIERYGLEPIR